MVKEANETGMEDIQTDYKSGEVYDEELVGDGAALSAAAVFFGPISLDDRTSETPVHPDAYHRRTNKIRSICEYGMDQVGEHVAAINAWIKSVHKTGLPRGVALLWSFPSARSSSETVAASECDDNSPVADDIFPTGVMVEIELESALQGLSACASAACKVEEEGEEEYTGEVRRIVEIVARIPCLMKTILLIEDEEDRKAVLSCPIIRRVMFCRYSLISAEATFEDANALGEGISEEKQIGEAVYSSSWLLEMLKSGAERLTSKALDYLEMISNLSIHDYLSLQRKQEAISPSRPPTSNQVDDFFNAKDDLFVTVSKLRLLIPHIFGLKNADIERAAVTTVVRRALDDNVSLPFSVGVVFSDLVCNLVLLSTWRTIVFRKVDVVLGSAESKSMVLEALGFFSIFY